MPQLGGFEILVIVVVALLVIGPKDFPHVLRKIGSWIGSTKRYFSDIERSVSKIADPIDEDLKKNYETNKVEDDNEQK